MTNHEVSSPKNKATVFEVQKAKDFMSLVDDVISYTDPANDAFRISDKFNTSLGRGTSTNVTSDSAVFSGNAWKTDFQGGERCYGASAPVVVENGIFTIKQLEVFEYGPGDFEAFGLCVGFSDEEYANYHASHNNPRDIISSNHIISETLLYGDEALTALSGAKHHLSTMIDQAMVLESFAHQNLSLDDPELQDWYNSLPQLPRSSTF
jgi:hypothetical protein